ncbi:MAG: hypothetical protein DRG35_05300 [Deltaproteobacteria bacterium]|nr:MAG: hypothetical protein DRG35_05300 [Deltaproteobacteria bacterium]RLB22372.1 MAG: hypothetical protein DRG73_07020 [Deltaproteobacteria bacterium]
MAAHFLDPCGGRHDRKLGIFVIPAQAGMTGEHAGMRKIKHCLSDKQADCSKWIVPYYNVIRKERDLEI